MSILEKERQTEEVLTEREQRARILEAAALEIEVRGWAQGAVCRPDGSVCAVGAIHYAAPNAKSFYNHADLVWYGCAEKDVGKWPFSVEEFSTESGDNYPSLPGATVLRDERDPEATAAPEGQSPACRAAGQGVSGLPGREVDGWQETDGRDSESASGRADANPPGGHQDGASDERPNLGSDSKDGEPPPPKQLGVRPGGDRP